VCPNCRRKLARSREKIGAAHDCDTIEIQE
jgi:hypothetical protein